MEPLISIIIPIYKTEKYLAKCVDSIRQQTYENLEIILVDDGSPDNCGNLCDDYVKQDKRIRIIHQENGGLSKARNSGIDKAKGEYIGFLDSDDYIESNMYELMIDYMLSYDLDIVCCDTNIVRGEHSKFRPRYTENKIFTGKEALNEILNGNLDNAAWNKLYKRECIDEIRYPVGRHYEDVDTTYLFVRRAKKVGYICKGLYNYVKHANSIICNSFNSKSRHDCFLGMLKDYNLQKNII